MAGTPIEHVQDCTHITMETTHKDVNMSSPSKELGMPSEVPAEPMSPHERGVGIFGYECTPTLNGIDAEETVKDPKVRRLLFFVSMYAVMDSMFYNLVLVCMKLI